MSVWRQNHFLFRSRMYFLKIVITLFLALATDWPSPIAVFRERLGLREGVRDFWVGGGSYVVARWVAPVPYGLSHLFGSFLAFLFTLCLFINTWSRSQCSGLGQSLGLRMGETTKTQITSCFISVSLRRLVFLYSRDAWGCIIVTIVEGLCWSASSLSAEEHKFNWSQVANCRLGRVFLLYCVSQQTFYKNCRQLVEEKAGVYFGS